VRVISLPGSDAVRSLKRFRIRSALEFGQHGITVNAYAPGPVKTPMCTLRCSFFRRHVSDVLLGDDLEVGLGTPPGVLEDQVRTTPILSLAI